MPTAADIQKAAERVRNGTDVISTILRMKKEAREALMSGNTNKLKAAGYNIASLNASAV